MRCALLLRRALLCCALPLAPALACDFDHAPSSHWSLAVDNGVDWLKTPCGDRFYSLGVNILDEDKSAAVLEAFDLVDD